MIDKSSPQLSSARNKGKTFYATKSRHSWSGLDGNDSYFGFAGNDSFNGGSGDDYARGWNGNDFFRGGDGNDILIGDSGKDTLYGDGGHDRLNGGAGIDFIDAGAGNDIVYISDGADTLIGGEGIDTLDFSLREATETIGIFGSKGGVFIDLAKRDNYSDELYQQSGFENVNGSNYSDELYGNSANNSLFGGDGDDVLSGGGGNDTLRGEDGNDQYLVFANFLPNVLTIIYEAGRDQLQISGLNGKLSVGQSTNRRDLIVRLEGKSASIVVKDGWAAYNNKQFSIVTSNADVSYTKAWGNKGSILYSARSDNETLQGGDGYDILSTGSATDSSAFGYKTFTGGKGADLFKITSFTDSLVITDFEIMRDHLELSANYQFSEKGWATFAKSINDGNYGGRSAAIFSNDGINLIFQGISKAQLDAAAAAGRITFV